MHILIFCRYSFMFTTFCRDTIIGTFCRFQSLRYIYRPFSCLEYRKCIHILKPGTTSFYLINNLYVINIIWCCFFVYIGYCHIFMTRFWENKANYNYWPKMMAGWYFSIIFSVLYSKLMGLLIIWQVSMVRVHLHNKFTFQKWN